MAPVQLFLLCSTLTILPVAWLRGGHPERAAVAVFLIAFASDPFAQHWQWGRLYIGAAVIDLVVWTILIWLSLRYDRWWLLVATAGQTLIVMSAAVLILTPSLTMRENLAAQWVLSLIPLYALLFGVGERRLAGERAASPSLDRQPASS